MKALVPLEKLGGLESFGHAARTGQRHGQSQGCGHANSALADESVVSHCRPLVRGALPT
jgi:hypothetical protein